MNGSAGAHLDGVLAEMEARGVDALLLGRSSNARFVSDAHALWLAGTRPWGPGCVVVRSRRAVHLLATSDAGVPASIPSDHLFPLSWNPMHLLASLRAIEGLAPSRRIGVDGLSPMFERLLAMSFPDAELVDGDSIVRSARRVKPDADVAGIRAAVDVAQDAMAALADALEPGATVARLRGAFLERMCAHGVTTPAFDPRVTIAGERARSARDEPLPDRMLVHVDAGVLRDGWEGSLGRTLPCGEVTGDAHASIAAWRDRRDAVVSAVAPGSSVADVRDLAGVDDVEGVGLGYERVDDVQVFEPGSTLAVLVSEGDVRGRDILLVTAGGAERLTTWEPA
jgi:Xaa-Pro aminopeptidase